MKCLCRLASLAVILSNVTGCPKDSLPTESHSIEFTSEIRLPDNFDSWERKVYVFDKNGCVRIVDGRGASGMKVRAGEGYRIVALAFENADNIILLPSKAGSEESSYKVTAKDFDKPFPEIWYGSAVCGGDKELEISFRPLTSAISLDFDDIPAGLDSLVFDIPESFDTWHPGVSSDAPRFSGSAERHVVLDTRGLSDLEYRTCIFPMLNPGCECFVPASFYYKDRYTTGFLPFKRRIGEAQEFSIKISDAKGRMFDSPFATSYELVELAGMARVDSGIDFISQWEYSYQAPVLPEDTTAFYVRDGKKMLSGHSFAFQFGSNSLGFSDNFTDFHSEDGYLDLVPVYAGFGFDHIRIPVDEGWCFFSNGEAKPDFKIELKKLVDSIIAHGMRVIIDFHWMASGGFVMPSGDAWDALPSEQEIRLRNCWRQLHEMFKDYAPEDLAYEIVNEAYCGYDWNVFLKHAINMMRSWGGNELRRVIFCPGESEGDDGVVYIANLALPENDPNLAATFHDYFPVWFCFYKTGFEGGDARFSRYHGPVHYPGRFVTDDELEDMKLNHPSWYESTIYFRGEVYDKSVMYEHFKPARAAAERLGVPVWIGEYGCACAAPFADRLRYFQDVCSVFRDYGLSYCFWFDAGRSCSDCIPDSQIVKAMVPDAEID